MRIRTIKPEFFTHDGIFEAEEQTGLPLRLAYIGLWCAADREGRFRWEPRRLRVQILPYDDVDFSRVLDALTTRGFLVKYASDGREFGVIPSFPRHQVINNRERESELPEPLNINIIDACPTRDSREPHAGKAEGKGREWNKERNMEQGKEGDGSASPPHPNPEKAKRQKFQKPTQEEWVSYATTMPEPLTENQAIGAWDYYEANGWKVGRNPMVNWQATLRAWSRRQKEHPTASNQSPPTNDPRHQPIIDGLKEPYERIKDRPFNLNPESFQSALAAFLEKNPSISADRFLAGWEMVCEHSGDPYRPKITEALNPAYFCNNYGVVCGHIEAACNAEDQKRQR